jgi:hypothetical protein
MKAPACLLLLWLPVFAQLDRAGVTGKITDPTGSPVPGAAVEASFPSLGFTRSTTSTPEGIYSLPSLPVGIARIRVTRPGFRAVQTQELRLSAGRTELLDVALTIAEVITEVTVEAAQQVTDLSTAVDKQIRQIQLSQLPLNGRDWSNLMILTPGAVDAGGGNGRSIRVAGHSTDANNFRIDGVDANNVRNSYSRAPIRLLLSAESIGEFRVSSGAFSADTGGSAGAQIEAVTRSGSNELHGSAFEYLRNNAVDARSPFDSSLPPLRLNQFGGAIGGAVVRNRSFFFLNYEGLRQRQGQTLIGFVPDAATRSMIAAQSPDLKPVLDAYPSGGVATRQNGVLQWTGSGRRIQDEDFGLARFDQRFSDRFTAYARFSINRTIIDSPLSDNSGALDKSLQTQTSPQNGVVQVLAILSPRTTNEWKAGVNHQPYETRQQSPLPFGVSVPGFTTIASGQRRVADGVTYSGIDQFNTIRGRHSIKAGVEIRRIQFNVLDGLTGTIAFANLQDFTRNRINSASGTAELPTRGLRKTQYFGFVQDDIRVRDNLSLQLGLRYEYFAVLHEVRGRALPFDPGTCGGFCPANSDFYFPDTNNLAPRAGLVWAPRVFSRRVVVRLGGGIYYGDGNLNDQYAPASNSTQQFSLSSAITPTLAYPINRYLVSDLPVGSPEAIPRHRRNETSGQWAASVENEIFNGLFARIGYLGSQSYHLPGKTTANVMDPRTGLRPLPALGTFRVNTSDSVSGYHALLLSLRREPVRGLLVQSNYTWSHAINDGTAGSGDFVIPQNVSCRACEKGDSQFDARHAFTANAVYSVPAVRNWLVSGWTVSGSAIARTGLPFTPVITRRSTTLPDGNAANQRPDFVPGVSLIPPGGRTVDLWFNPAAFALPASGVWGNAGRNILRGPGVFQVDTAVSRRFRLTEQVDLSLRVEAFNILNRPQLGQPSANVSATNPGQITARLNTGATGSGTPRQFQFALRLAF